MFSIAVLFLFMAIFVAMVVKIRRDMISYVM